MVLSTPDLTGTGADPSHHIVLFDGSYELGFVVSDQGGDLDERTFRRFPFSTPADPYVTEKQASFGGGMGQATFEENRAAYWRSTGVDTTKERLVLGPQLNYAKGGFEQAYNFLDAADDVHSHAELVANDVYVATRFTPSMNITVTAVKFYIGKDGTPPSALTVAICSDNSGNPGTVLASTTVAVADVEEGDGQWIKVDLAYSSLSASTNYWIRWSSPGGSSTTNHWHIGRSDTVYTSSKHSTNGSTWATHEGDHYFRIEGTNTSFIARFLEYKGQMYFVKSTDDTTADELWMNGWRGACDVNTGQLDNLEDSSNSDWASKITGDEVVEIVAGPTSKDQEDYRLVNAGNLGELANGTLPITPDWKKLNSADDDYIVYNTDWFQEISTGSFDMKKVIDIAVAGGKMYLMRSGGYTALIHREHNDNGTWRNSVDGDNWNYSRLYGDYAVVERDPVEGDNLWLGVNASGVGDYRPRVCKSRVKGWGDTSSNFQLISELDPSSWVSANPTHVDVSQVFGMNMLRMTAWVGKVNSVSINNGGSGYTNGTQTLTLVDSGSSGTAQVSVEVTGNAVTSINSITTVGYDYTTGVKATTGGGGTGCQIEITGTTGFTTGLLAYRNLTEQDATTYTVDVRHIDSISLDCMLVTVTTNNLSMAVGDLELSLDDGNNCSSPFVDVQFPQLIQKERFAGRIDTPSNLNVLDGAEACASIGVTLATSKTKSFTVYFYDHFKGFTDTDEIIVGHRDGDDITGMNLYGDPEELWVFTESGMGAISNNRYKPVPLRELAVAHHPNNGRANEVHDVYLLFSWRGRLQRYFRQNLEDLGPDFPGGLGDISGDVVDAVTYPGRVYVAVDGGTSGKSLILCYKGGAWHEIYTSFTGERIRKLFIQSIPGKSDRLWASVGSGVMWFPIALQPDELPANSDYKYRPGGSLQTSWIYTSDMDLNKLFRSAIMIMDRASDSDLYANLYYKIDDEDASWTSIPAAQVTDLTASAKEYDLSDGSAGASVQGNRIRFKIELHTHDLTKSPVIRSIQSRIYRLPEVRYAWSWIAKVSSISINLRGDEEKSLGTESTVLAALNRLDGWGASLDQLTVDSSIAKFNGRTVICEPVPYQLLTLVNDEGIEEDVIQVTVNDI